MRLVILSALFALAACNPSIYVEDRQSSPDGQWVAEVNGYIESDAKFVTLTRDTIFGKIPFGNLTNGRTGEPALLKWLSNSHLVIAALDEEAFPKEPASVWGVQLTYLVYSTDPNSFQDEKSKIVTRNKIAFSYIFKKELSMATLDGVGCSLTVASLGEQPERQVRVRLTADKDLYFDARQPAHYMRSYSFMTIAAPQHILKSPRYVTGAAFNSIVIGARAQINRNYTSVKTPVKGNSGWQAWQSINRENLLMILDRMKSGQVEFDFGFWLDNTEEIYTSIETADLRAIEAFEHCIAENKIFE
jgi:hypothetical protein